MTFGPAGSTFQPSDEAVGVEALTGRIGAPDAVPSGSFMIWLSYLADGYQTVGTSPPETVRNSWLESDPETRLL